MASEGGHGPQTSGEYISHHLQNLQVCKADGEWIWNHCAGNPMTINVDSMFFSVILGLVGEVPDAVLNDLGEVQ